jgi:hypothetical protein
MCARLGRTCVGFAIASLLAAPLIGCGAKMGKHATPTASPQSCWTVQHPHAKTKRVCRPFNRRDDAGQKLLKQRIYDAMHPQIHGPMR